MKHFIIEITYKIPIEQFENIVPEHRAFLQTGYDKKLLLFSGPQEPRVGGIVVARAESVEEIKSFFENDPYKLNGVADYRFIEFNPVKHQEFLSSWIN
ncbi:MAG: YciI family protein [bacterium]